ncbi:MarR family transcriptional regulator [Microbacterium sp. zg.Y1090]|uniref:MarR family winged helix-turn-helix transcriptional regulator n=1 Tax=Microbacterium TaxID=33882 RepID=UPI00214C410F|nr:MULTISPECIES: MarR family transcriptional regulator [unclassified Microbacterium]MCR2812044.1 MarR family transcriptional regulator [Microbacterium sp. zg.Y1084]MCR2818517.1 MarR family transcriptional regulator [Microbacterium sp. zg.Y1090]MDL5486330.1 MarR family transcriptional regulator [Microbacterium sp. zg-Y1211]WIM29525.1 MarR family transcriptional regulator [Microbacterium sp. zg-Y1090]
MTSEHRQSTGHDRAVRSALQAVRSFSDSVDRMHSGMKDEMEMNATDVAALRMLIMREQRGVSVSPHDVSRHLRISTASTTKLLDRLSESGHIVRRRHPSDRRALIVALTDRTRQDFHHHFGRRLQDMRAVADHYTDEQLATVTRFLEDMGKVLDPDQQ